MTVPLAREAGWDRLAGAAVVPAGLVLLLARPGLESLTASGRTAVLAAGYLALAAAAATANQARAPRTAPVRVARAGAAPVRARAVGGRAPRETPVLTIWAALAVGLVAVAAVALLGGPSPPVPARRAALVLGLLAAAAEEALFRGVLFGWLERLGPALAVGVSALLFALVHIPSHGPAALPVDLGAGLLLGWQRWASGRWTVPAATHAAANLLAVIPW